MIDKFIHRGQAGFGALLAIFIGIVFLLEFYVVSAADENTGVNSVKVPRVNAIAKIDTVNPGAIARSLKPKKVNINSADISELMKLSGIGRTLANRIVKYRNENGQFKNIDELKKVNGLGTKKLEKIRNFIEL